MTDKQIIKQFSDGYCLVLEDDVVTLREDEFTKYRIVLGSKTNELLKFVKDTYLQLKAKEQECDRLKETFDGLFKVQYKLADNNKKLRQCLTEIKEIASREAETSRYNGSSTWKQILQKISEVKE